MSPLGEDAVGECNVHVGMALPRTRRTEEQIFMRPGVVPRQEWGGRVNQANTWTTSNRDS